MKTRKKILMLMLSAALSVSFSILAQAEEFGDAVFSDGSMAVPETQTETSFQEQESVKEELSGASGSFGEVSEESGQSAEEKLPDESVFQETDFFSEETSEEQEDTEVSDFADEELFEDGTGLTADGTNAKTGFQVIGGKTYYILEDGTYLKGALKLDGKAYWFDKTTGEMQTGAVKVGTSSWCFYQEDGIRVEAGWVDYNGNRYYVNPLSRRLLKGWQEIDGKTYYFNAYDDCAMLRGCLKRKGKVYWFDKTSGAQQKGLVKVGSNWYFFRPDDGSRVNGGWIEYNGNRYYVNSVNKRLLKGFQVIDGKTYYFNSGKKCAMTKGCLKVNGKTYWFHKTTGVQEKGIIVLPSGRYYFGEDGSRVDGGWVTYQGASYYVDPKLHRFCGGWKTINGKEYHFNTVTGVMDKGLVEVDGYIYFFADSGERRTGFISIGSSTYLFNPYLCIGKQFFGGKTYFLKNDGQLMKNVVPYDADGKHYKIDANGVATELSYEQYRANLVLNQIGRDLRTAFNWSSNLTYYRYCDDVPAGMTKCQWYSRYGFERGCGNCHVMACTFYQMAVALGYEAHYVYGYVPLASGGVGHHGWVEIVINGTTYVCDPDFYYNMRRKGSSLTGYMITYGTPGTWMYQNYHRET